MKLNVNGELKIEIPKLDYNSKMRFVIFGIGEVGREIYEKLCDKVNQSAIHYIIDSVYPERFYKGTPVIRPNELGRMNTSEYYFILGSLTSTSTMKKILLGQGIDSNQIYTCTDIFSEEKILESKGPVRKICIYPRIDKLECLNILINKITWFLNMKETGVRVFYITDLIYEKENENIDLVNEVEAQSIEFDIMLVWDYYKYDSDNSIRTKEVYCIDEDFFSIIDLRMLTFLRYRLSDILENKVLKYNESNFKKNIGKYECAFIFGLGGTLDQGIDCYLSMKKESDLKIVCNTAVFSKDLMDKVNPNLYVLSDEIFLTKDYSDVMNKIINEVTSRNCYLVVPIQWVPLIMDKYGSETLSELLIGIDVSSERICFPSAYNLKVYKKAGNVITRLAIPLASAFCDKIYFIGCDGKALNNIDGEMWSYSNDLKKETEKVFNNTFKKTVVGDVFEDDYYLLRHYEYMEELINFGEGLNKEYYSLTESYIPVLEKRRLNR